jgi:hypothetical protein
MGNNQKNSGILEEIGQFFVIWYLSTGVLIMLAVLLVMSGRVIDIIPRENIVAGLWILSVGAVMSFVFKVRIGFNFFKMPLFLFGFSGISYLISSYLLNISSVKRTGALFEAYQSLMQTIHGGIELSPIIISASYVIFVLALAIEAIVVSKSKKRNNS